MTVGRINPLAGVWGQSPCIIDGQVYKNKEDYKIG